MNITVTPCYVADFDGTELQDTFAEFDGSTPVVQAYDRDTGLICALARAEGQSAKDHENEARYQLALYIHRSMSVAAGDASDPRA